MRDFSTCCPHTKPLDLNLPRTTPDEKLEFVEHVLGVLIESRYGPGRGYTLLGEGRAWPTNLNRISADELEMRLDLLAAKRVPFYESGNLGRGFRPATNFVGDIAGGIWGRSLQKPARSKGITSDTTTFGRNLSTLSPTTLGRGSPEIPGTFFFASSFANFASLA